MTSGVRTGAFVVTSALLLFGATSVAQARTITPTVFFDGMSNTGNCTLREAVQASNTNAAVDACPAGHADKRDTIELGAGEYNLTVDGDLEDSNATGDLDMRFDVGPLRIRGLGMDTTVIDAEHDDRVIESLSISNSLTIEHLTALGNHDRVLSGGVILTEGAMALDGVEVADGEAQFGGGVSCFDCDGVKIIDSLIRDNHATTSSTGSPGVQARGGGVSASTDGLVMRNTTVRNNEAVANDSPALGGGIHLRGSADIRGSTIQNNDARSSSNSTADSSVRSGGGIHIADEFEKVTVEVSNSTISGNVASFAGHASSGGGIAVTGDVALGVTATTFSNNNASFGTQISALDGGEMEVDGSIFASSSNSVPCAQNGGKIKSKGYNVLDAQPPLAAACLDGQASAKDVIAEPATSVIPFGNGGPTATHSISADSPAIDLVPKSKCRGARKSDQRGAERPAGKGCDAGSYERTTCAGTLISGSSIFGTSGKDDLSGTAGVDVFAPSAGADRIKGGDGDDRICGGSGDDRLKGGDGADQLIGGKGSDDCDGGPGNDSGKSCEKEKSL